MFAVPAVAADLPVKAPVQVVSGGFYVWVDGTYNNVNLPTYSLGLHLAVDIVGTPDAGRTVQNFRYRIDGGGVRAGIGYYVPGTNYRLELDGSYVSASGSNTQLTATTTTYDIMAQLVSGAGAGAFICSGIAFVCTTNGTLSTSYSAWQFGGRVLRDYQFGSVGVAPFISVFGGTSDASQTLSQAFAQLTLAGAVITTGTYNASTSLRWTDFGARAGLDLKAPVGANVAARVGGWVGVARRSASLSASDTATSTPFTLFNGASVLSASANKTVLLANLEGGLDYQITRALTLRGFAGLNYDGDVPGITNPTFTGQAPIPTSRTPAQIYYQSMFSYYAGGGLRYRFGG